MKYRLHTILILLVFLIYSLSEAKGNNDCKDSGYPQAYQFMEKIIALVNQNNFDQLKEYSLRYFSNNEDPFYRISSLVDLKQITDHSENLQFRKKCYENDSTLRVYYKNQLTGFIDRIQIIITESDKKIKSIGYWPADLVEETGYPKNTSQDVKRKILDEYLVQLSRSDLFSGTVMVSDIQGKIIYHKSFGKTYTGFPDTFNLADPFSLDEFRNHFGSGSDYLTKNIQNGDMFNLASLNKIFTATSLLQLVEKGRISPEDFVVKWLPDLNAIKEVSSVKIKHLLSHTSGINYNFTSLYFEPGTRFEYSNAGYTYLGKIIEKVSGMSYDQYLRLNILAPMGMSKTATFNLSRFTDKLVIGTWVDYANDRIRSGPNPYLQKYPGSSVGGYYSTTEDLLRFATGLVSGKLIKTDYVELMKLPKPELGAKEYGFGVMLWRGPGIWGHAGDLPGADTDLEIYQESGYIAIVLSNMSNVNSPVLQKIRILFSPTSVKKIKLN